ncbi:MAG: flagellar hook-associated protein FlgK [Leptospiraceae bacterium]|nr:flagellar hook-associated protein FlgK [Leptospiraceae bacterium]
MGSTFGGLEVGKRGVMIHRTALNTTGHNIANADNEHYARQRVTMEAMDPLYEPSLNRANTAGQIGQGAQIAQIERIRDAFFDDQIIALENDKNYWQGKELYFSQMEHILNEPSDNTLRHLADNFWQSWQELANYPDDLAHREVVLERANALTTRIQDSSRQLTDLRARANQEVQTDVERINSLAGQIRDLNERILKLQALGDNPNDLQDRRDMHMQELSKIVNVRVGRSDRDEMFVFIGEQALVQGEIQRKLITEPDPANEGMHRVIWEHNQKDVILGGGHLHAMLELRDTDITGRIDAIDGFALNVADIVNEVHKDGFGLDGSTNLDFFQLRPLSANARGSYTIQQSRGNFDLNNDGSAEVTAVFRVSGQNTVNPEQRIGLNGQLVLEKNDRENTPVIIDYRADDTLNQVIKRINDSKAGVVAYMNHDNQLAFKATTASDERRSNFMIRHLEDTGELLTGYTGVLQNSGKAGAFDFRRIDELGKFRASAQDITLTPTLHPGAWLRLSSELSGNPAAIAAGRGKDIGGSGDYNTPNGMGDSANALLIASALKQSSRMIGHARNPEEFYNQLVSQLGVESRTARDAANRTKDDLVELSNFRQSVMGVSLDEEMSNMVQFQHSYNASARLISTINQMLDTIIRLGA